MNRFKIKKMFHSLINSCPTILTIPKSHLCIGTYPIKPNLPSIGGNEGLGEVLAVGSRVKSINVGDWVLMASSGLGKIHRL